MLITSLWLLIRENMSSEIDTRDTRKSEATSERQSLWKPDLSSRLWKVVTSQKKHIQNLSVLVFVNFLIAGLGFLTKVKIANTLGREAFGLFAYALALGSYGVVIVKFGLDRTFVRDLIHYPRRFGQLVAGNLVLRGLLLVVVILVLVVQVLLS